MSKTVAIVLLAVFAVGSAQAGDTLFTFDDGALVEGQFDIAISAYMSLRHPGLVVASGAQVHSGDGFGDDLYLWVRPQFVDPGDILIVLTSPVNYVSFDGYVFDATPGADFTFTAYNLAGEVIHERSWYTNVGDIGNYATGLLPEMAYGLNFSNSGSHDIGIDNLRLAVIPAPGAGLLGVIGAAVAGCLRRRGAL